MSSSNSNKQSQIERSLKLTNIKQEHKQQSQLANKQQKKQITLNKFVIKPNNNAYFIGIIRIISDNQFRLTMLKPQTFDCWISKPETFDKHHNDTNTSQNINQFRNDLLYALTKPNNKNYEIHEKDHMGKDNKNKAKELTIYRKGNGIQLMLAKFKLFPGNKNLVYVLEKSESTLNDKKKEHDKCYNENKKLQKKNNKLMDNLQETINEKNKSEHELLNKFVLVLNEKKKKIKALKNELLALKSDGNVNVNMDEIELKYDMDEVEYDKSDNIRNKNVNEDIDMMDNMNSEIELSMAIMDENDSDNNNIKVIDDGSLDISGVESSKKRKRDCDVIEVIDLDDEPKNKRRKSDTSDSSFEFNTDLLI